MMASLVTLDPGFIEASLDLPERDISGDQTVDGLEALPEDFVEGSIVDIYDPYPMGSVFASVVWDIYEGTDDQLGTLNLIFDSTRDFGEMEPPEDSAELKRVAYLWLDHLVSNASEEEKAFACPSIETRFGSVHEVEACF